MAYMVLLVLNDPNQTYDVLDAWEAAGVPGVTLLDSTGIGRVRQKGLRDDTPLIPSLVEFFRAEEQASQTMFSVVEREETAEALARAAQSVVGDFEQPETGLLLVIPLSKVYGLNKKPGKNHR